MQAVIGNEHVQDMLRNTLQEDGLGDALKEAIFEPKMTRSKVKQVLEQEGGQVRVILVCVFWNVFVFLYNKDTLTDTVSHVANDKFAQ